MSDHIDLDSFDIGATIVQHAQLSIEEYDELMLIKQFVKSMPEFKEFVKKKAIKEELRR